MTQTPPIPFPRSYWVIPGQLLAGLYPGDADPATADQKLRALLDCGIRKIVNLMEEDERDSQNRPFVPYIERMRVLHGGPANEQISFSRYPIPDGGIPTPALMCAILDDTDASLAVGQPVYVHCWGGKGRTGTVIGCYLARHNDALGDAALKEISRLRQHILPFQISPENEGQCSFVRAWRPGN